MNPRPGVVWTIYIAFCTAVLASPTCRELNLTVPISAFNLQLPTGITIPDLVSFLGLALGSLANIFITGTYTIHGRYCTPEVNSTSNKDIIQLLVHGSARDLHYWNGVDEYGPPYQGSEYSWVERSSLQGYPTLAIDRIGNGRSSHPDPIAVAQVSANVEVVHGVVAQIKNGVLGRKFNEVVYVGHSMGSIIGQLLTAKYPNDVKRVILTGWAPVTPRLFSGTANETGSVDAASRVNATKWGGLSPGYLTTTNDDASFRAGGQASYAGFDGPDAGEYYDPKLPKLVFDTRGTASIGEAITVALAITPAPQFRGKVLALTGQNDTFWCGKGTPDCGQGASSIIAQARGAVYPNAIRYDYLVPQNTGHELIFHYSANDTFAKAFSWLQST